MEGSTQIAVQASPAAIGAFISYLVVVIGIGVYATRFSSSGVSEFFVGGRKMNRFVVALSAVVSGRSAWLLLGLTGMAYSRGASAVWAAVGYIVVELFLFLYYAKRLRRFSERYDSITVPDFFVSRFGDPRGVLRICLVVIILIFMVSYVSAQLVAGGKAFAAGFGLDPVQGILLTAAIVLVYTVLGGFLAVSLTDVIQATFMIVALVVLPLVAFAARGGLAPVLDELRALDANLLDPMALSFGAFAGFIAIGLGSPGNPHILARYMSIVDAAQLRWAAVVGTIWNVVMAWGAIYIGLVGRAAFPDVRMLPGADTENLYPVLAQQQLSPILFGLVVASIFAAIMSTADSQLLVAASSVVRDLYEKLIARNRDVSQARLVMMSRLVVAFLVIAALALGMLAENLVFWLVLFAWAGLGASIGPTSILALYWNRATKEGMIAGLVTGTVVTIVWEMTPALNTVVYELIPAFVLAAVATVVVSLMTKPPADVDEMMGVMSGKVKVASKK